MQPKYYGAAAGYNKPGNGGGNGRKVLKIAGIGVGVIFLLIAASTIISALTKGPQEEYARLVVRQDSLVQLLEKRKGAVQNSDLHTISDTAYLLFSWDSGALNRQLMPAFGLEAIPETVYALEADTTTEAKFKNATLVGTYDRTYLTILNDHMSSTVSLAQTIDNATNDPKVKAAIKTMLGNIHEIQDQLERVQL